MKSTTEVPKSSLPGPPYTLRPTFTHTLSLLNPLDYIRLLYWVFFHPQWVREYVKWLAPDYPKRPRPWETRTLLITNARIRALAFQSILLAVILPFSILFLLEMVGVPVKYGYGALGVVAGVLFGLAGGTSGGVSFGLVFGVAGGVTFGAAVSVGFGVVVNVVVSLARGAVGGVALGVVGGVAVGNRKVIVRDMGKIFALGVASGMVYGATIGVAYGVSVNVMYGVAFGMAVGLTFILFYSMFFCRLPFYLLGVILGIGRDKQKPHLVVKGDGAIWLPLPGIRREIVETMQASPPSGVALCVEYMDYSLQFIPVIQAMNEVLSKDSTRGHSWCRLLLMYNRHDLIRYGTVSLRNYLWNHFLEGLIVIPRRSRDHWFPRPPRLDSPDRAVCAGYYAITYSILPGMEPVEEILESLDKAIDHFLLADTAFSAHMQHSYEAIHSYAIIRDSLACKTPEEIAMLASRPTVPATEIKRGVDNGNFAWLESLPEPELRPELLYALRELRSAAQEAAALTGLTSRAGRLSASARANDALRVLKDYADRECYNPEKTLLQLIIEHWIEIITKAGGEVGRSAAPINKLPNNYITGPALRNQQGRLFVGRDDIYREVVRLWSNEEVKQPLVFYGQRRMGKTSILLHMEANLGPAYLPVFLDMQALATVSSLGAFLYNLADKTTAELHKMGLALAEPKRTDYEDEPFIAFRKFIETAEAAVTPGQWAVLMLDEFELVEEKLNAGIFPGDLMLQLRNIMQHHPRLALVMAGSHHMEEMRRDYWNPLLSIARVIKVGFLKRDACYELITNPWEDFPLEYEPGAIEEIIRATDGQPLLIQTICSGILERVNKRLAVEGPQQTPFATQADAEAEIENTLATSDYFPAVIKALPAEARTLLKTLAQLQSGRGAWVGIAEVAAAVGMSTQEKTAAWEILERRDMIDLEGDKVQVKVEMVRSYLIR
jgi:hypothetical protein